jgi:membrane-associated protein
MISLEHLHGLALLAVLCLLIFVEECGVPLPFAPGDLLLAICGLAIRRGGLNPVVAIGAVYLTTVAGAMAGRELFDLVGARLLVRLVGRTRLRSTLERGRRLLERGGWPAVLVARLTPGLRITTTEVAGLLRLPRRTFLLGLAPAAAVYVGVFVGAGMLFGHAATGLLLRFEHRLGLWVSLLLVVLLWIAAAWLTTRLIGWSASRSERGRA